MDRSARRQQLLDAARAVFVSKGYHDAKVDDIVAAAHVAKGTFYLYFPDKRSVFAELVDALFTRIAEAILRVDVGGDISTQVRQNIHAVVGVLLADPALTRILMSYAAGLDPAFVEKIRSFYDGVRELLVASLVEGQALGIVAPGDARIFASFTIGGLKEVLLERAQASVDDGDLATFEDAVFGLLQAGYLRIPREKP